MAPTLIGLSIVAVVALLLYLRVRTKRAAEDAIEESGKKARKFDTTLGDFHEMREALRPLEHTRSASRREPRRRP